MTAEYLALRAWLVDQIRAAWDADMPVHVNPVQIKQEAYPYATLYRAGPLERVEGLGTAVNVAYRAAWDVTGRFKIDGENIDDEQVRLAGLLMARLLAGPHPADTGSIPEVDQLLDEVGAPENDKFFEVSLRFSAIFFHDRGSV